MVDVGTAVLIAGMIIGNSLLTVITWYYILNKTQENIKDVFKEVKSTVETVKQ